MVLKRLPVFWIAAWLLVFALPVQAEAVNLKSQVSARKYSDTVVALRGALNGSSAKIFQEVDHRNNAVNLHLELPPSRVFIFGNPEIGTRLMQCAPLIALDLPLRMLVRQDDDGHTRLYWTETSTLVERYSNGQGEACRSLAAKVDATLAGIARKAAGVLE